jgi:hypothetical protein
MKKYYKGKRITKNKAIIKKKNFEKYIGLKVWQKIAEGFKQTNWEDLMKGVL